MSTTKTSGKKKNVSVKKSVKTPSVPTADSITRKIDKSVAGNPDGDDNYISFTTRDKLVMGGFRTKILRSLIDVAVECRRAMIPAPVVNNEYIRQRAEKLYPDEDINARRIKECVNRLAQMGILDKGYVKGEEAYRLSGKVIQTLLESKYDSKVALRSLSNTF